MPLLSTPRAAAPATGPGRLAFSLVLVLVLILILAAAPAAPVAAQAVPESVDYCMACHSDETLELPFEDGDTMSLYVELQGFLESMHGGELVCTDCHEGYDSEERHPSGATFASRRQYVLSHGDACKQCHFDTYTRTLESIHHEYRQEGFDLVPVCTDCHGAHVVSDPHEKEAMISRSCATCHEDVYRVYAQSAHGRALVEEGTEDVPSCADCHTAHSIQAASTVAFRLRSPEICISCHGDAERMAAHGLSTWVATSYLSDFHGVTAALADPQETDERRLVVTCVDCHGVHDIRPPEAIGQAAMVARVRETCEGCHEGAAQDFPAAWLSHYEPSIRHAPLVWAVDLFYKIFIPFVTIGLALQVGLHLVRATARR